MLFNLTLETGNGGVQMNGVYKMIEYADDLALIGEKRQHVRGHKIFFVTVQP